MNYSSWKSVWKRAVGLAAPATGQRAAGRLITTADVFITAALSPAAVVALGISAFYVNLPSRIGTGFIGASRTLVAQDTGAGADANRDEALSQAALLFGLVSLPFVAAGMLWGPSILELIGANEEATRLGGTYLLIVLPTVLVMPLTSISASSLEATGDTTTPLYFSVPADVLNAAGSLVFGLGLLGAPKLGIVGIGGATLVSRFALFAALVSYVQLRSPVSFTLPSDPTITKQLVRIGAPHSLAGAVAGAAIFPLNTLLLQLGTAVNAGFQIAWRIQRQVVSPVRQGLGVATGTIVGQKLGEEDFDGARTATGALLVLSVGAALVLGGLLALLADPLATLLTDDSGVAASAAGFVTFFGVVAVLGTTNGVGLAILRAGSETRIPMVSRIVGMVGGMVGVSWLLVAWLDWGVLGVYVGLGAMYVLMLTVTAYGLTYSDWIGRATSMMAQRSSISD